MKARLPISDPGYLDSRFLSPPAPEGWRRATTEHGITRYVLLDGDLRAVVSEGRKKADGLRWRHLSVSREYQMPTDADIALAARAFLGPDHGFLSVTPTQLPEPSIFLWHVEACLEGNGEPVYCAVPPTPQRSARFLAEPAPKGWTRHETSSVPVYTENGTGLAVCWSDDRGDDGTSRWRCVTVSAAGDSLPSGTPQRIADIFLAPNAYVQVDGSERRNGRTTTHLRYNMNGLDWFRSACDTEDRILFMWDKTCCVMRGLGGQRVPRVDRDSMTGGCRAVLVPTWRCWQCDLGYHRHAASRAERRARLRLV
jgi:hypothetical protein